jgi:large subunit ribosomal protein L6
MSRLGKRPIPAPSGVTVTVSGQDVNVKGPKGALSFRAHDDVAVSFGDGQITVKPRYETPRARALWGTTRAVLANNVKGVTQGFEKSLEMTGVGYRVAMQGKNLQLNLGYSHEIIYTPPEGVTIAAPKPTEIKVSGIDPQAVGQAAAEIRSYRPPEPYKGKGVRYAGEHIRRKEGKKK